MTRAATTRALAAALVAAACGLILHAQGPGQAPAGRPPQPAFRTGIDVVSLNVTVTTADQQFVTDLEQDDFLVFEDGVKQDVSFFTRSQLPIALALLLDTSARMDDKMATAQEAAIGFARRLRPEDVAQVIDFDSRVTILQGFTNDAAALEKAIRATAAGGSTSMYNAIYIALNEMKKVRAQSADDIRRRAIVVLSDGEDTSSLLPFEEVLELVGAATTGRRDVDDDQPVDQVGVPQRQDHRDLAAHRVAHEVHRAGRREPVPQLLGDQVGGLLVAEVVGPRRPTVVRQVDQQRAELGLQGLGDRGEVLALTEQAVEERDRLAGLADLGGVQVARRVLAHPARLGGWSRTSTARCCASAC